jgi:hypothetical protein
VSWRHYLTGVPYRMKDKDFLSSVLVDKVNKMNGSNMLECFTLD